MCSKSFTIAPMHYDANWTILANHEYRTASCLCAVGSCLSWSHGGFTESAVLAVRWYSLCRAFLGQRCSSTATVALESEEDARADTEVCGTSRKQRPKSQTETAERERWAAQWRIAMWVLIRSEQTTHRGSTELQPGFLGPRCPPNTIFAQLTNRHLLDCNVRTRETLQQTYVRGSIGDLTVISIAKRSGSDLNVQFEKYAIYDSNKTCMIQGSEKSIWMYEY